MSHSGAGGLSEAARALLARRAGIVPHPGPRGGTATGSTPLASPQLGQWLASEMALPGGLGTLPKTLHLEGQLDRAALRRALTEIARRHEALRTIFFLQDGEPVQRVMPPCDVSLREVDLRTTAASERAGQSVALLDQDARRPFDLSKDLLMRPVLVQVGQHSFELQVTFQHVAFDGWSNGLYLRELGALYSAYTAGRESPLTELPLQYADFATWERSREATPAFGADQSYWKDQVAGGTSALDLPTDRPRRRPRTDARATVTRTIDAALTERLSQVALEEGTTLFAVALASFQVLVGRRAGRDDFVLGAVSANRALRDIEELIGTFVTILPVRAKLGDAPAFRTHLRRTAESLARGSAHQSFPFQRLLADLRPAGGADDPLYDVVFNYRNMPVSLPTMEGLTVSDFRAPHLGTNFDLHLSVTPEGGRFVLELDYNPDLFLEDTAGRWLEGYRAVLEAVAADPDTSTAQVPVMPARERRLLMESWSGAAVPSPPTDFVMDRFERAAIAFPAVAAVEHHGSSLTFRDLHSRVRRNAAHLRQAGIGQGHLVGLFADRSIDTIAAMLAILSIGAVYVPLDPGTPGRRIDTMLERAGLRLILTDQTVPAALANRPEPTLCLSDLLTAADPPSVSSEPARIGEEDPAYVIFTSGSTGAPKGVVVSHGSLARYTLSAIAAFEVGPGDRLLQFAALTFDVSVQDMFLPLTTGGTLVLRTETMLDSPRAFVEQCRALHLTHVPIPTALWAEVARSNLPGGIDLGTSVRVVSIGGEAAPPDSVRNSGLALPRPFRLLNCYGPTETTINCTWTELNRGGEDTGIVPIGRPLPGVTAYVLDERHQPVPIGTPGELWIGGGNLALGYLAAPELTAEKFVADSFSGTPGARLYKTGDTVRWLADGQLTFMGRKDSQVKVRGYRVELPEIERVLGGIPGVRQAAVIVHEGNRLVAFVAAADPHRLLAEAIRDTAAIYLPPYMVPTQIVVLERLPLGATGKMDRQQLRAMIPTPTTSGGNRRATTETESVVARIWEKVLGVTDVGPDDRFLELGGHSLLAMRVANLVHAELGVRLSMSAMLSHSTVASLARELDRAAAEKAPSQAIARVPRVARPTPPA